MKFNFRLFFALCFCTFAGIGIAQDLHFTQFEFTPVLINPGQTGNFKGTYRLSGIYRDQSVSPAGVSADFKTPYITIDVNFGFAFRKKDWTSLGISFFDDRSGDINIGKGGFLASGAYHLSIGGGDLALGAQYGSISFDTKNPEKAIFYDQLQSGGTSQDLQKLQQGKGSYQDLSAGLALTTPMGVKKHSMKLGFSLGHLNKPTVSVLGTGGDQLGMLLNVHGSLQYHYNEKIDFIPSVYFRSLEKNKETIGQCMVSYLYDVEKKVRLNAGLGYRFGDALQIMAGLEYGKIKGQIGYDHTLGDLKNAKDPAGFGALELGIQYTGAIVKKPNPKPKVFCPRF